MAVLNMADADIFGLPSYETARLPDAWPYVVPYLPRRDIINLALVSRKLQGIAQGTLWAEPRTFWNSQEETVDELHHFHDALSASRRLNGKACLYTQTLDLSHLGSDSLSFTFARGWASKLLSQLPALRSFLVSHSDAFDHNSIDPTVARCEQLRLLSVISCPNLTPKSFHTLLRSASNLYFLEASECPRLRNKQVIEAIADLSKLGVLKLARSNWSDEDILLLTRSVISNRADANNPLPQNIRSLDLNGNWLSDDAVNTLKFLGEALPSNDEPPPYAADDLDGLESGALISSPDNGWSAFFEPRFTQESPTAIFSDARANVVRQVRSPGFRSPVEIGDLGGGLTHLRLSNNKMSASAVVSLLGALPLEELDCGNVIDMDQSGRASGAAIPKSVSSARAILDALPDCPTLKHLTIGYQLVTGFVGCESQIIDNGGAHDEPPPYPYAWLRHQGTQWDPMVMTGLPVKMFQFSPSLLALEELALTGVPREAQKSDLVACMTAFVDAAGEMQEMVRSYLAQRGGLTTSTQESRVLGTLKELHIHVESMPTSNDQYGQDAEAYIDASLGDFSFFPDEKETNASIANSRQAPHPTVAKDLVPTTVDVAVALKQLFRRHEDQLSHRRSGAPSASPVWTGKMFIDLMSGSGHQT